MHLRHTATFGARVYSRGSMLINHFDRSTTHIASAVLQIGQTCDEGGGWPLEVLIPKENDSEFEALEVYLQPGEMVLYEGARIKHGRPMRFRGTNFTNIFTHFAPVHGCKDPYSRTLKIKREELRRARRQAEGHRPDDL